MYMIDFDNKIHKGYNKKYKNFETLREAKKKRREIKREQRRAWRKIKQEW